MGNVHVFPIVQNKHVLAYSDPKWQRSATTPVRTQDDRNVSLAKTRLRRWKDGAWDIFELDFETQTLAFRPLSEGTSDPLRSSNTERVRAIRCAPRRDPVGWMTETPKAFGQSRACEADQLRSDLAGSGHGSIAISLASMNTNGADLIDPWKVRHDCAWWSGWSPRVRGTQLSRNSRPFGAKTFLPAILHITKRCQKLTKLTSLAPRRVFSKSVEGLFWLHNTFCFMPL